MWIPWGITSRIQEDKATDTGKSSLLQGQHRNSSLLPPWTADHWQNLYHFQNTKEWQKIWYIHAMANQTRIPMPNHSVGSIDAKNSWLPRYHEGHKSFNSHDRHKDIEHHEQKHWNGTMRRRGYLRQSQITNLQARGGNAFHPIRCSHGNVSRGGTSIRNHDDRLMVVQCFHEIYM